MRLSHESAAARRVALAAAWLLAAILLAWHAATVRDYLDLAGRMGLRGAAQSPTPLKQIYPAFAADAQTWVRYSLSLLEGDSIRLRHTDIDNAPDGREVHWNSAWAWTIAGAGRIQQAASGGPIESAVEKATIWLGPATLLLLVVLVSSWISRRAGALAGVFLAAAMVLHERLLEGFFASYCDHHGLLTVSVLGLVLGAAAMNAGWSSRETARSGAIFSAVSGALGVWVSAASVIPAIAFVGASAAAASVLLGKAASERGETFDADAWVLWGRLGAALCLAFYLFEYFPQYLGWRLEVNHPLYALAWWGGGELVARVGARRFAPRDLLWPALAILAAPLAVVVFGARVMSLADPFLAQLHRLFIGEFEPLLAWIKGMDARHVYEAAVVDALPLAAAAVTIARLRRATPMALAFATLVAAALFEMALWQMRWNLNASAGAVVLTLVLMDCWASKAKPAVRWALAAAIVLLLYVPGAITSLSAAPEAVAGRSVKRFDAQNVLARDMAAALRASQPAGDIVVLSSPVTSTPLGYYGRFRTLGTYYWENAAGLEAAAAIWSAPSDEEALRLLRAHGVTHVALVGGEEFIWQYYLLLHPGTLGPAFDASFGGRVLRGGRLPPWLHPIAYEVPADLRAFGFRALLFRVEPAA
ncbi:MAG TPA: hypothetical protein VLT60_00165 [Usitatibacter sp.]|nr:hypothetical protein [Usitatibacter sp.]